VIATGTPEEVARVSQSYTGQFLAAVLPRAGPRRRAAPVAAG
jgi:excinuclease ABC subunit A